MYILVFILIESVAAYFRCHGHWKNHVHLRFHFDWKRCCIDVSFIKSCDQQVKRWMAFWKLVLIWWFCAYQLVPISLSLSIYIRFPSKLFCCISRIRNKSKHWWTKTCITEHLDYHNHYISCSFVNYCVHHVLWHLLYLGLCFVCHRLIHMCVLNYRTGSKVRFILSFQPFGIWQCISLKLSFLL